MGCMFGGSGRPDCPACRFNSGPSTEKADATAPPFGSSPDIPSDPVARMAALTERIELLLALRRLRLLLRLGMLLSLLDVSTGDGDMDAVFSSSTMFGDEEEEEDVDFVGLPTLPGDLFKTLEEISEPVLVSV